MNWGGVGAGNGIFGVGKVDDGKSRYVFFVTPSLKIIITNAN